MKNAVGVALGRCLGLPFFLGALAMAGALGASGADDLIRLLRSPQILPAGYHIDFLLTALDSDMAAPFVPIVAVLPFAGSYVEEIKSKFARFSMLRTSFTGYLLSHALACFLSGAAVVTAGVLLAAAVGALCFLPMELAATGSSSTFPDLLRACVPYAACGGMWALLGMTMSTLMESKYIAYASPFVIYYLLVILYERYFPNALLIYPRQWLVPSSLWPFGIWGPTVLMVELSAMLGILFCVRGKRRLMEL